jgi:tetratricopeptide (TPR) repeat protein
MTAIRPEVAATCHGVLIEHHPDPMKPRSQYLDLLRLAATEDPTDDRSSHYLGREYFYNAMYQQAIDELLRHLALPKAIWESERAASMRYVGKCYEGLGNPQAAQEWYVRAVLEEASRETLIEAARFSLTRQAFYATVAYCQQALTLPVVGGGYMEERYARAEGPYDLMAVALWHIAASDPQRDQALTYARQALSYNPSDPRLIKNLHMMQSGL